MKTLNAAGFMCVPVQARCNQSTNAVTFASYSQAYDFKDTAVGALAVDIYTNSSKGLSGDRGPPMVARINEVSTPTLCYTTRLLLLFSCQMKGAMPTCHASATPYNIWVSLCGRHLRALHNTLIARHAAVCICSLAPDAQRA